MLEHWLTWRWPGDWRHLTYGKQFMFVIILGILHKCVVVFYSKKYTDIIPTVKLANLFSFELRVFKTPLIRSVIITLWELEYQWVKHFIHMLITISCSAIIKSATSKTHSKRICKGHIMKNVSTDPAHMPCSPLCKEVPHPQVQNHKKAQQLLPPGRQSQHPTPTQLTWHGPTPNTHTLVQ